MPTKGEHTPGPWELWSDHTGAMQIMTDDFVICARNAVDHRAAESQANARLMAAASDMLAALLAITGDLGSAADAMCLARAAIAKATGKGKRDADEG